MERANAPAALHQRQDGVLVPSSTLGLATFLLADIGFVTLDDFALAAHRWTERA